MSGPVGTVVLLFVALLAALFAGLFVAVEGGASPTGFAGLTSSSGAFRSTVGADFGAGPSKELSGVGVGEGFTRLGREDWALEYIVAINRSAIANRPKAKLSSLGIRFFI